MLGEMAYTWDVARDLKLGRVVRSEGGLASSLGFAAQYDAVQRMTGASTGRGSTEGGSQGVALGRWSYAYGQADELVSITEATGGVWQYASGAEGRITSRSGPDGSEAFAYDGEGRRSEDASSRYTYDWRGRLVQVDIKTGGHAGERIVYAYDATGRLLSRTNLGQIPPGGSDSDRPFIAKRAFVWDGQRLAAEAGLNFQDQPLWRQQYAPGQRGLDDAPLVRVEKDLQATPSTETYAILRDDMGTPVAVVEEAQGPGSGGGLRLLVRYLSAPYGQRQSELGPELVAIEFDATITKVASTDQRPTANQTVAGALRIVTTSPLASASLTSGLVLEQWDAAAASWQAAARKDFAIGAADDDPTDLRFMRLAGWAKAARYRIKLLPSITDTFGRGLVLPTGESQGVVLELAVPEDGTTPPSYARVFPLAYDKGASDTFAGAFPGGQTFGFQGAWTDPATGLAYHRARWYDAANATWLSEDPLQDLDSPNLYAFVRHNPMNGVDPSGMKVVVQFANPEDLRRFLFQLRWITGLWVDVGEDGTLVIQSILKDGAGKLLGSETARKLVEAAIRSPRVFVVEENRGQVKDGGLAAANPTRRNDLKRSSGRIFMDLPLIYSLDTGRNRRLTFDVGMIFLHELGHFMLGFGDPPRDDPFSLGEVEQFVNRVRDELGLPRRLAYNPSQAGPLRYLFENGPITVMYSEEVAVTANP